MLPADRINHQNLNLCLPCSKNSRQVFSVLIVLLSDLGWITFLMPFGTFVVQNFAIGFAILVDKSALPVLPRWIGFFTIGVAILCLRGALLTLFKTGPFAWDGLFVLWVPLT